MKTPVFCTAGDSTALRHGKNQLLQWGYSVTSTPTPQTTHLLLPVPSMEKPGVIKGNIPLEDLLGTLPEHITILGGNLPVLGRKYVDLLKDEYYLTENATITAHCTMEILAQNHHRPIHSEEILIIGWGRIGKQLSSLLKAQGANVTVAVRKDTDLQALQQLGFNAVKTDHWDPKKYQIIINTAPALVLNEEETSSNALLIDLASIKGIAGDRVIWAKGLPNLYAPDLSGILIAKTALRYALGKE